MYCRFTFCCECDTAIALVAFYAFDHVMWRAAYYSAPSLGVYYFLSLTLSVCLFVTLLQIDSSFFVSRWNRAILWPSVVHVALYKTLFFDFWFRPPTPQNLLPKIWQKIAYKSACMAHRPEMFGPTRWFSGMADSMEPCKMFWGRPLLPWQRNLG